MAIWHAKATHDYAIKTSNRRMATLICLAFAFLLSLILDIFTSAVKQAVVDLLNNSNQIDFLAKLCLKALALLINYLIPLSAFGAVCLLYDKVLWKCSWFRKFHKIPNFTGTWKAEVISPLKDGTSTITMKIRQDWNKLYVEGISAGGTQTDSYTASITMECKDEGSSAVVFSYAYYITTFEPEQMDEFKRPDRAIEQRYPGFNSLVYDAENDVLKGDYFSNKDIALRTNSKLMNYVNGISDNAQLIDYLKGCGSKGQIRMERVSKKC